MRSDVSGQIRKVRASIGELQLAVVGREVVLTVSSFADGRPLDELVDGVKVADWLSFAERLYAAKRKADKRIAELGGMGSSVSSSPHRRWISLA